MVSTHTQLQYFVLFGRKKQKLLYLHVHEKTYAAREMKIKHTLYREREIML